MRYSSIVGVLTFSMALSCNQTQANQCLKAIDLLGKSTQVPSSLLHSIAKVESGFGPHKEPWPWAIQVQGRSYYFRTEKAAARYIKQLLAIGIENFDVGCGQINYYWHKDKVRSPFDLLNPAKNILIAANYLKTLKAQHNSWLKAVAHYHSSNQQKGLHYARMVFNAARPS